ncbi:hypothetical protein [Novosphingobium sp.]|uniref:hypothetical protein n=1 Tax=Novosphingobium sp. TaxID=1874826 RepID=UPI002637D8FB|nr:hypothetical protein [Novosphingobium sp.]
MPMIVTRRRLAAFGCTLVLFAAVCCLAGARLLVAVNRGDLAAYLPYGAIAVMRSELHGTGSDAQSDGVLAALQTSPLIASALNALELRASAEKVPDQSRGARFLLLAGRLGWRDISVQRKLYNMAVSASDFGKAVEHADAIMRVAGSQEDLDNSLRVAANVAAFRTALLPYFRQQAPWTSRWLVLSVNALSDPAVVDLAQAIPARAEENAFGTAAQVMWALVAHGRFKPALEIDSAIREGGQTLPLRLEWPARPRNPDSPFAWQLGKGYAMKQGRSNRLEAIDADRLGLTYRLLALPPGEYEMNVTQGQQTPGTWQWAMGCGIKPLAVAWLLETKNEFSVEDDCPVQWIALRGDLTSTPLDVMTIRALDDDQQ